MVQKEKERREESVWIGTMLQANLWGTLPYSSGNCFYAPHPLFQLVNNNSYRKFALHPALAC